MSRPLYLPVIIMVAAIASAPAHAGFVNTGLSSDRSAGFADIPNEPSVLLATGDFNRDGIPDMVEARLPDGQSSGQHFLSVLLGRADGTFTSLASHNPIGSDPRALVVGDFNGDGNPDVIVGDADGSLLEFLGDGSGKLAGAGNLAKLGSVVSIATGRFTHDGNLDLVVSDFDSNSAIVLLGVGDGSFRRAWSFQLPKRGTEFRLATADFNKDGIADLVITGDNDGNYEVMLGNGNGTFTYSPELSHLRDPYSYCPT